MILTKCVSLSAGAEKKGSNSKLMCLSGFVGAACPDGEGGGGQPAVEGAGEPQHGAQGPRARPQAAAAPRQPARSTAGHHQHTTLACLFACAVCSDH